MYNNININGILINSMYITIFSEMALYQLFSYNVEVQYKNYLLSKAALFSVLTTIANIVLPFIVVYESRGFRLESYYFYEQPLVQFNYEYLLIAETDDPSVSVICGQAAALNNIFMENEEFCAKIQIQEEDYNGDGRNDELKFKTQIIIPSGRTLASIMILLGVDFLIMDTCPLQMQSLAAINNDFCFPPNSFQYYGDLHMYQTLHLPCLKNTLDTRYNVSLFEQLNNGNKDLPNFILQEYLGREVISMVGPGHIKSQNGYIGTVDIDIILRIPEIQIRYIPSLLQEFKYAWPQYLSLAIIFYYLIEKIKIFVFRERLLMAWEIVPWKKKYS